MSSSKLSWGQRWAYALGNFASMMTGYGVLALANYVFPLALGVDPALVGMALAAPRLVDLFTDPAIGFLSDRWRRRFTRQAFIAAGTVLSAASFAAVWWFPAGLSSGGYFAWLLIFSCATAAGWSVLSIPWQALGFELTADSQERTRLMAAGTLMLGLAGIGYSWAYAATLLPVFSSPVQGARWVGSTMAGLILITGLVTARYARVPQPAATHRAHEVLPSLGAAVQRVFRSRPFMLVAGAVVLMCVGVFSVTAIGPYLAIYYLKGGDQHAGSILVAWSWTAWQATCALLAGTVNSLAIRWGKSRALIGFLSLALAGNAAKWVCYSPAHPGWFVVPSILFAAGFTGLWTLAPSMVADICDYEESRSGRRDDGTFAGFYTWMIKLGSTVAFAAGGWMITLSGFAVGKGAAQGAETILRMRIVDFSVPAVSIVASIWLLMKYPLSESALKQIRRQLVARAV